MIAWVRTWLFRILFYGASVPIVLTAPISAAIGRDAMHGHAHVWIRVHRFLARWILGVRVRVEGERPRGTYLFAVKHQAMFETLEMAELIDGPLIVMKRELIDMPFWGKTAKAYGAIGVDRDASSKALRQMLLNLLTNAVKFTPPGGRVTLRAAIEPDGRLAIVVTDTGAGMRRADIPKAMEAFGQVAGDKTRYAHEGTGLGLPITAALVRLHGGTLVIDSQIGRGTSATLRFPHERILDGGQVAAA